MIKFFLLILVLAIAGSEGALRAVTVLSSPYTQMSDGKLDGFCIDLLNEITAITGDSYTIYLTHRYGTKKFGKWNGMIGDVLNKKADLAIADITITEDRKKVVDFTTSFLKVGLTAIMKKSLAEKIQSWEDLLNQTEIKLGTIKSGSTYQFFSKSNNPLVQALYRSMSSRPEYLRGHYQVAERVNKGDYVFVGESASLEYITSQNCDLTLLQDEWLTEKEYAFAMAKGSPNLSSFNLAISQLKANATIDQLKNKWWKNLCDNNTH